MSNTLGAARRWRRPNLRRNPRLRVIFRTPSATPTWHAEEASAVLQELDALSGGLTSVEAAVRRARFGANELPPPPRTSAAAILVAQLLSVVVFLLVIAAAVAAALGDVIEALAIGAVLVINTMLGFVSELRARRAMERILAVEVPHAWVVRDGTLRVADARDLVPGDVVDLSAGRQVPADARLLDAVDLRSDEAALTGESVPVSKRADVALVVDTPLAERVTMVYKGTTVITGVGRAVVTATGPSTEVGRIGSLTASVAAAPTPLERRLDALGHRLVWMSLGAGACVAALSAMQGSPLDIVIETGLALAIAAVPEALPAVATIALAIGMHRMARRRALVRRLPAVESLGSTTVICTDKTRTLTSGEMSVVAVRGQLSERQILEIAALASRPQPESANGFVPGRDPVDAAVLRAAAEAGVSWAAHPHPDLVGLMPFLSERKLMAAFHRVNGQMVASVKGAPRQVLALCGLDQAATDRLRTTNNTMARDGLRVIAVAQGAVQHPDVDTLGNLTFAGFIGLADPPAPGVKAAIARLRAAGLRTVMLTGDQRLTAEAVGRDIGVLEVDATVLEGRDLDTMDERELEEATTCTNVFSRITPEHKLRHRARATGARRDRGHVR